MPLLFAALVFLPRLCSAAGEAPLAPKTRDVIARGFQDPMNQINDLILPMELQNRVRRVSGEPRVQVAGNQIPGAPGEASTAQIRTDTEPDIPGAGLTPAAFRTCARWGAGGLGVLLLTGAGILRALREKLKRQRSEAGIISAHNASLETRVAERTAELAAANERLTRASDEALTSFARERELGDLKINFVSMVSHEFRTPLAVILSSTELLSNHLDRLTPDLRAQQLASIRGSTQQMSRLI